MSGRTPAMQACTRPLAMLEVYFFQSDSDRQSMCFQDETDSVGWHADDEPTA